MLTGTGTDANGDSLTYIWEQMDNASSSQTGASSAASATKASGPNFQIMDTNNYSCKIFPKNGSILAGATTTAGSEITVEALSSCSKNIKFQIYSS
jgi:hypothetical protein